MVKDQSKRVSAFAVSQAQQGKHKLAEDVTSKLSEKVQKLHQDRKLNSKVAEVSSNYERNLITNKKKKDKRDELRKNIARAAHMKSKDTRKKKRKANTEPALAETEPALAEKPLSWYSAPKSDKRVKVVESKSLKNSNGKRKRRSRQKKLLKGAAESSTDNDQSICEESPDVPEESPDIPEESPDIPESLNPSKEKNRTSVSPAVVTANGEGGKKRKTPKLSSRKVSVSEWNPPGQEKIRPEIKPPKLVSAETKSISLSSKQKNGQKNSKRPKTAPIPQELSDCEASSEDDSLTEVEHEDPEKVAQELFAKLIYPHDPQTFFKNTWLKKPLHIKRSNLSYYEEDNWFSTTELDRILAEERVRFGVNIDVTTYTNGKRETHNPAGRAYPAIVWDHYQQGCSVRLLNPQTYSEETWYLLSTLQELFGCMMGANVYLTPPGTQGFAPHFDDIEAFVLQLEGKKRWRVYGPRTDADVWPLTSSPNLSEEKLGKPILDCVLEPGDLLYFPRGSIHQAAAYDDEHSLHITVSTHQQNSWSDLLNLMVPAALANATENDPEFRESLPNGYLNYTGISFQDQDDPAREAFLAKAQKLMEKLVEFAPVDGACDLMAKKFMHDTLPPYLDPTERGYSVAEQGEKWVKGEVRDIVELQPDTRVRLMRKHGLRIVNEPHTIEVESETRPTELGEDNNEIHVYFNTDNDRLYHGNEPQYFAVDGELAPAVEFLQLSYPEFVSIDDLPLEDNLDKVDIAMQLYDRGLLLTEELLNANDAESSSDSSDE